MKAKTVVFLLAVMVTLVAAPEAQAQAYPTKPIKIIVPFPPGDTVDTMSRLCAPMLTERLGQPVIVENRPGASGIIGTDLISKAVPDGYTIGTAQGGTLCNLPFTRKNIPYNALKDFTPIALATTNYLVIYAGLDAPFKTLPEMIAYAKAHPGKMTMASNGEGGFPHLAMEHLRLMAGFTYNHIPYKGSAQINTDLMGGQVQMSLTGVGGAMPAIRSGRVNLLAVTSKKRAAFWPDKPAVAEFVPGYDSGGWFGFVAPAGVPLDITNKLHAEFTRAMNTPEVVEKMVNNGMVVANESVKYFEELIRSDYAKYGKLVRDIGFKPQ